MSSRPLIALLAVLLVAPPTLARTVCEMGCDHMTIADALSNASGGETIEVIGGTYMEGLLRMDLVTGDPIQLVGSGMPLINGSGQAGGPVIRMGSGDTVQGFKITGGMNNGTAAAADASGGGVQISAGGTLRDCEIFGNVSTADGGGVGMTSSGTLIRIENCQIHNNQASSGGGGISTSIGSTGSLVIVNSRIYNNDVVSSTTGCGGGVRSRHDFGSFILENSHVYGNDVIANTIARGGGICLVRATSGRSVFGRISNAHVYDNTLSGTSANGNGLYAESAKMSYSGLFVSGNTTQAPSALGGGIYLSLTGTQVSMDGVNVTNNESLTGGGIYCTGSGYLTALSGTVSGNSPDQVVNCQECNPGAKFGGKGTADTRSCSTGLAGVCATGTQTCQAGGIYGECEYTDNPLGVTGFLGAELQCADGVDNDCDGDTDLADSDCNLPGTRTRANAEESTDAGDPVNTLFGELYQRFDADLDLGGPLPLHFTRYHASGLEAAGLSGSLGTNWRHNFDWSASIVPATSVDIVSDEGRLIQFVDDAGAWVLTGTKDIPFQLVTDAGTSELILGDPRTRLVYAFDPATGRLETIQDGNLNTLTLSYTGSDLTGVTDGLGRTLTLAYSGGLLTSVTGDGGRVVSFGHTGSDLTSVIDVRLKTTTFAYDPGGLLTSYTRPRGNTPFSQVWGAMDQVASQTDAEMNTLALAYDSPMAGDTTVTDPGTNTTTHTHSTAGAVTSLEDETAMDIGVGNDAMGRRGALVDRLQRTLRVDYDDASGQPDRVIRPDGSERRYGYTGYTVRGIEFRVLASIAHPYGALESFGYDAFGNLVQLTDAEGNTTTFTHNAQGLVTSIRNALGAESTFTYNPDGTRASATDPAMNTTSYGYDSRRRLNLVTYADTSTRSFTHDDADHPLTETDPLGQTTTYTWDDNGNLATVTDRENQVVTLDYDDLDRLTTVTDPNTRVSSVGYDALGRVESLTDENLDTTTFGYDARGRLVSITDPENHTRSFEYDDEGVVSALVDALMRRTAIQTDSLGRTIGRTSPLTENTGIDYDPVLRVTTVIPPEGGARSTEYDVRGQLARSRVAGLETALERNALGQVTRVNTPRGTDWLSAYDTQGRLTSTTDPLGRLTTVTYDSRNRPDVITFPATMGSVDLDHDANGNLTQAAFSDGTTLTASYDNENRIVGGTGLSLTRDENGHIIESNGVTLTRDAAGRVETITYALDKTITYTYDKRGRVLSLSDWLSETTSFQYDSNGRLTAVQRPNGVDSIIVWDENGRRTRVAHGSAAALASTRGTGLIIDHTVTLSANGGYQQFDRIQPTMPAPFMVGERFTSVDDADQFTDFVYDDLGRATQTDRHDLTWNLAGSLVEVRPAGGDPSTALTIDRDLYQRPISVSLPGGDPGTTLVWDGIGGDLLILGDAGLASEYVLNVDGVPVSVISVTDTPQYPLFGIEGHLLAVTDAAGTVTYSAAYSPTGERIAASGTSSLALLSGIKPVFDITGGSSQPAGGEGGTFTLRDAQDPAPVTLLTDGLIDASGGASSPGAGYSGGGGALFGDDGIGPSPSSEVRLLIEGLIESSGGRVFDPASGTTLSRRPVSTDPARPRGPTPIAREGGTVLPPGTEDIFTGFDSPLVNVSADDIGDACLDTTGDAVRKLLKRIDEVTEELEPKRRRIQEIETILRNLPPEDPDPESIGDLARQVWILHTLPMDPFSAEVQVSARRERAPLFKEIGPLRGQVLRLSEELRALRARLQKLRSAVPELSTIVVLC